MRIAAVFFLAISAGVSASAATLNFNDIPDGEHGPAAAIWHEAGAMVAADPMSDGIVWYSLPGAIHIDDSGTSLTQRVDVTTGGVFSAVRMAVVGYELASYVQDGEDTVPTAYQNIAAAGFRDGLSVASAQFSTGLSGGVFSFSFGSDFRNIDLLRIAAIGPWRQMLGDLPIECSDAPCGHFDLDSLTLAPVPLPGGFLLAFGGVAALAGVRVFGQRRQG